MHKSWYVAVLLGGALLTNVACAQAQQAAEQRVVVAGQRNASDWFRVESQHFVVYSNTSNDDVAALLHQLERLDYVLRIYTQPFLKSSGTEPKLTFYYYDRAVALNALAISQPVYAIGLYNSCNAGVQGFGVQLDPADEGQAYLFEAYTRHFLYRYTDIRAPISFIDGFAQYFASARFTDDQVTIGKTPINVRSYLNFLDSGRRYSLDYKDVLEQNDSDGVGYGVKAGIKLEFAARSWLLTHYMLSSEDKRKRLVAYLSAVYRDVPITQAFEQAYGLKVKELSTMLWRYRNTSVAITTLNMPELPRATMEFTKLPQSSGEFILAEAALKSCPDSKQGEALLRRTAKAAAEYPSNDYAQRVLSRAQVDWGNPQDALRYLEAAAQKPDAELLSLLGQAHLRMSQPELARGYLTHALSLDPQSTEAAYALYQAGLQSGAAPDPDSLQAAISAFKSAREVNTLARSAALAYAYAGETARARNALKLMAHNIREPELAAWAKTWLEKVSAGVGQAEVLAEMRKPAAAMAFREWTLANAEVMQEVERNAGLQDLRARIEQPQNLGSASQAQSAPSTSYSR